MDYLLSGHESKERVTLLLSLTSLSSEPAIKAIFDHLVIGYSEDNAAMIHGITQPNFSRAMKRINRAAETVERIKELDWDKFKSVK